MTGIDDAFAVLADERRRSVLRYLRRSEDGTATVDELAEHASATGSRSEKRSAKIHLHHAALPHLADRGYIDYDPRTQVVAYRHQPVVDQIMSAVTEVKIAP